MAKVHFTKEQLRDILMEVTLNGDEALNTTKNIQTAVRDTMASARNSGVNTDTAGVNVSFGADTLKKNGLTEDASECAVNPVEAAQRVIAKHGDEIDDSTSAKELYAMIYDTIGDEVVTDGVVTSYEEESKLARLFTDILNEINKQLADSNDELYECFTKKQLKEAKLNKMVAEAKAVMTKKQLMEGDEGTFTPIGNPNPLFRQNIKQRDTKAENSVRNLMHTLWNEAQYLKHACNVVNPIFIDNITDPNEKRKTEIVSDIYRKSMKFYDELRKYEDDLKKL